MAVPAVGEPLLQGCLLGGPHPSHGAACGWCCCRRRRQSLAVLQRQLLLAGSLGWGTACWLLTGHGLAQRLTLLPIWRHLAALSASRGCGWAPAIPHPGLAPPLHGATVPHETAICCARLFCKETVFDNARCRLSRLSAMPKWGLPAAAEGVRKVMVAPPRLVCHCTGSPMRANAPSSSRSCTAGLT